MKEPMTKGLIMTLGQCKFLFTATFLGFMTIACSQNHPTTSANSALSPNPEFAPSALESQGNPGTEENLEQGLPAAVEPITENHPHYFENRPQLRALGQMYEAAGLTWSGIAPVSLNHADAVRFCELLGARLPTIEEYEILSRLLGQGTPENYNPTLMSDMITGTYWSASLHPMIPGRAYGIIGHNGKIAELATRELQSVRCVTQSPSFSQ